ncbi:acyl-CoA dehydratase activase [Enterococcus pseudoavium]|uniref:Acyl-CoA dehydratase activase n=1 Tax=Enterococcus pseudoavium TaxID=44007 RepID=A0ABU3FIZ6_9ENTE|nr:acyl-CoA dehydratase activase [Enterococcus pseudoavium]MDT2770730.1 acyl-CoA dehydratase activase [Enterococcus pseudoavium]
MYTIGLDSGSTTTKGVLFFNTEMQDKYLVPTAGNPKGAMTEVVDYFKTQHGLTEWKLVTTGYGRKLLPADLVVTEITCHGKGAEYLHPGVKQVIDIGGQDCKTIQLNGRGSVVEFSMNDRCAAGTGRFVEVMMRTLGEEIADLDRFVQDAQPVTINSMCTVFAESEVISLISKGEAREDIALGVLHSIAQRISSQYVKLRPTRGEEVLFTGGLSKSATFAKVLAHYVAAPVQRDELSQYAGAIGAAQIGIKKLG